MVRARSTGPAIGQAWTPQSDVDKWTNGFASVPAPFHVGSSVMVFRAQPQQDT
jgi:hypothetical protein